MKIIYITSKKYGIKECLVDDEDYDYLMQWKWHILKDNNTFYVRRSIYTKGIKKTSTNMHRFLLKIINPKSKVDHRDHNGLNNQKDNLRICTHRQNCLNKLPRKNSSSKYLGVTLRIEKKVKNRRTKKIWMAMIKILGKNTYLGIYESEIEAAIKYNEMALKHFGEFANLNKINETIVE